MIPKIIHFCWFGGKPKPAIVCRCIESWRRYCPDWEIREWNEENFDFTKNKYAREAYEAKKWAFVADYARAVILRDHGGVYMDTDQELLRPIDSFLRHHAFSATEDGSHISAGLMGAELGSEWIKKIAASYDDRSFITVSGTMDLTTMPQIITDLTAKHYAYTPQQEIQDLGEVVIYPSDYFYPMDHAGRIHMTENTHAIHHYAASWAPLHRRFLHRVKVLAYKLLPISLIRKLRP